MIPVFVGTHAKFAAVEPVFEKCLRANTASEVDIVWMRPEVGYPEGGCTGFTMARYAVPEMARRLGYTYGVYLDVDMLVLGDIAELAGYYRKGRWVCLEDGTDEVSVICASLRFPPMGSLTRDLYTELPRPTLTRIPRSWNVEDKAEAGMNLLHLTALDHQPWFHEHPDPDVRAIWEHWRDL